VQELLRQLQDLPGIVAEKRSVCRFFGRLRGCAARRPEAHVQHAIGLVEHEHLEAPKSTDS
jgi:hypothetical protein